MIFDGPLRFDAVTERDLDFLILEEFCCSQAWGSWFFERLRESRPDLPSISNLEIKAARSVSGVGTAGKVGETDLFVIIEGRNTHGTARIVVLVEDKISAPFMADQPSRYGDRARRNMKELSCDYCATAIIAPQSYLSRPMAGEFDLRLPLELVMSYFDNQVANSDSELSLRYQHRRFLLENACKGLRRSVTGVIPHEHNTRLISDIDKYVMQIEPRLSVKPRPVRGAASYGPGFDLPSKEMIRNAAKAIGVAIGGGKGEINFNWFLSQGIIRIRFHSWPGWTAKIYSWLKEHSSSSLTTAISIEGKCIDVCVNNLPIIDSADGAVIDESSVNEWIAKSVKLQEWFERCATGLASSLFAIKSAT